MPTSEIVIPDTTKPRKRAILIDTNSEELQRAAADNKVQLAISSEIPYLRGYWDPYYEILDHSPRSIVLDRLNDGAALLFNHNTDDHLGLVDKPLIGNDRVLRGTATFASNSMAQEKKQDVANGTLRWVSVSYRVLEQVLEKQSNDGPDTYRVTKWEPLEVSLVTVPADPSVGVGRSLDDIENIPPEIVEKLKTVLQKEISNCEDAKLREENLALKSRVESLDIELATKQKAHDDIQAAKSELEKSIAESDERNTERLKRSKAALLGVIEQMENARRLMILEESRAKVSADSIRQIGAILGLDSEMAKPFESCRIIDVAISAAREELADISRRLVIAGLPKN